MQCNSVPKMSFQKNPYHESAKSPGFLYLCLKNVPKFVDDKVPKLGW